jgi:Protein of unknown function (DUF3237)
MTTMPHAELVFEIIAECSPPEDMGVIDGGKARMIPIIGGTVSGPRLSGTVMPGADWSIMRENGVATVEARYAMRADDGTIIQIFNAATTQVGSPREDGVMMITTPRFIAPEGPHAWLNRGVYVGTLVPDMSGQSFAVKIGVFLMS